MDHKQRLCAGFIVILTVGLAVSCIPIKTKAKQNPERYLGGGQRISAIQTKAGEKIRFSGKERAYIIVDKVFIGSGPSGTLVKLPADKIKNVLKTPKYYAVETTDGQNYVGYGKYPPVADLQVDGAAYRSIPLSDIELVWVSRTNWPLTILVSTVVDTAVLVGIVMASGGFDWNWGGGWTGGGDWGSGGEGSCPLIFSHNGTEYVLDAEPYGGALCRGLERVEWVGLDNLKPVDGRYKLLVTNEADETDRTDELKLVVVDHAPGITVVPDAAGRMRTVWAPQAPLSAVETRTGRDILSLVSTRDERFWVGRMEGRDVEDGAGLKDTLRFEFAKPAGARRAKLVANVWNTAWGVDAAKTLLTARGRALPSWVAEVDAHGPAYWKTVDWFATEDMFMLQARVETVSGWKTKALLHGSGSAIAKDKAYDIDLGDVPGDRVKVELAPAAGFWMIDRLALDFGDDAPVHLTELAPASAVDEAGRDVRGELEEADGRYQVLASAGARAEVAFAVPSQAPDTVRSVFVKARGYYEIHLSEEEKNAEPDSVALRTLDKRGESLRYVLMRHPVVAAAGAARAKAAAPGAAK